MRSKKPIFVPTKHRPLTMKGILARFLGIYVLFTALLAIDKAAFLFFYRSLYANLSASDYADVLWHGLPLDLSTAAYLTLLPALLLLCGLWLYTGVVRPLLKTYFLLVSLVLAIIFTADMALYRYWGFRLDATPLFYFLSSPKDALASVPWWMVAGGVVVIVALTIFIYMLFASTVLHPLKEKHPLRRRGRISLVLLVLTAALFIPIRGGFSVSTMNVGKAYYSHEQFLNHAAVNPAFNLLESVVREQNFAEQYRFMSPERADVQYDKLTARSSETPADSIPRLLRVERPNIIFVVLESFLSKALTSLGGLPDVAANMDTLAADGVLFTRFYANSFRTDRGLVSLFSGYPAQPTTSIMKYPRKSQSLPSIFHTLRDAGYAVDYYYGGDANFTNMRSYLYAMGVERLVSDVDFPLSERLSKWGAHDHVLFNRVADDLESRIPSQPFIKVIQTSSSHEPFDVPFHRLDDPFLNAVAYTDSCLGDFVARLRRSPSWDNTLVVCVPDHAARYPQRLSDLSFERYEIPLLWTGGAIAAPMRIATVGSQIDIAATLLTQMGLSHGDFPYSKDLLDPAAAHFAYFAFPDAFGLLTADGHVVFDCGAGRTVDADGSDTEALTAQGQAFLQKLFDDLDAR
jgi:phosphoglycerol transferase MdoB-like AlkP superfamily enzyme